MMHQPSSHAKPRNSEKMGTIPTPVSPVFTARGGVPVVNIRYVDMYPFLFLQLVAEYQPL